MYGFKSKHKIGRKDLRKMLVQNLRKKQGSLNLFFEAQFKLQKKKQLYKCKASDIDVFFNPTLFYFCAWFSWAAWWGYEDKTQSVYYIAPSNAEKKKRENFPELGQISYNSLKIPAYYTLNHKTRDIYDIERVTQVV